MATLRPKNYTVWGTTFTYYLYHDEKVCIPFYNSNGYTIRATRGYSEIRTFNATNTWAATTVGMCMGMTYNLDLAAAYRNGQIAIPWDSPTNYYAPNWTTINGGFWNHPAFNIPPKGTYYMVLHSYTPGYALHSRAKTILLNTSGYGGGGSKGYVYQTKPWCAASKMDDCYTDINYRTMYGVYIDYVVDAYYVRTCGNKTIYVGQSHTPSATAYASDNATALSRTMSYSYGTPSVFNGSTGLKAGTCVVRASCSNSAGAPNSTVSGSYTVTVRNRGITLSGGASSIYEGHSVDFTVGTTPSTDGYIVSCKYGTITKNGNTFTYKANKLGTSTGTDVVDTITVSNASQTAITASKQITVKPRLLRLTGSATRVTPGTELTLTVGIDGGDISGDIFDVGVYKWSDITNRFEKYPSAENWARLSFYDTATGTIYLNNLTNLPSLGGNTINCTQEIGKYQVNVDVSGKGYMCTCSGGSTTGVPCYTHFRSATFQYEVYGESIDPVITAPLLGTTTESYKNVYMSEPVFISDLGETVGCYLGYTLSATFNGYNNDGVSTGHSIKVNLTDTAGQPFTPSNVFVHKRPDPFLDSGHYNITNEDGHTTELYLTFNTKQLLKDYTDVHHWLITVTLQKQIEDVPGIKRPNPVHGSIWFHPTTTWFLNTNTTDWWGAFLKTRGTEVTLNHNRIGTNPETFKTGGLIMASDANAIIPKVNSTLEAYGNYTSYIGTLISKGDTLRIEPIFNMLSGLLSLQDYFTSIGKSYEYEIRARVWGWGTVGPGSVSGTCDNVGSTVYFDDVQFFDTRTKAITYKDCGYEETLEKLGTDKRTCSPLMEMLRALYIL